MELRHDILVVMLHPNYHKWAFIGMGTLLVAVSVYACLRPYHAYLGLVHYTGICLLAYAFLLLYIAFNHPGRGEQTYLTAEAALNLIFGSVLLFNLVLSYIGYPLIISAWMFLTGCLRVLGALVLRKMIHYWGLALAIGILLLGAGWTTQVVRLTSMRQDILLSASFGWILGVYFILNAWHLKPTRDVLL